MSEPQQPVRWGVLSGIAAAVVVIVVAVAFPFLDLRPSETARTPRAGTTALPPAPAEPARLAAAVTKVASEPARAPVDALRLVGKAHTIVFAADRPGTAAPASMLALHLHAPVVLVPTRDDPSASPTADRTIRTIRADLAAAARQRGVTRAITLGEGVDDVAADSGAREIVRVPVLRLASESTEPSTTAGTATVIQAAAGTRPAPGRDILDDYGLAGHRAPAPRATGTTMLVRPDATEALAAVVAARAVGHTVVATNASDLRADQSLGALLADVGSSDGPPALVVAGVAFATTDERALRSQAAVAMTGAVLPSGDQLIFDRDQLGSRRYVGLYGVTHSPDLGALGEQALPDSVARVKRLARAYAGVVDDHVKIVPCFEIIATIASSGAGDDRNYSHEQPIARLREAVDAAEEAGVYVLLDLQPGRTDFLTQAKRYESLLKRPHVGLALDPEWRLGPRERHLEQVGSVAVEEVNQVAGWLADLVEANRLPQKMFLLHQFRLTMLPGRERLDTSRDELAYVIQMDGQGAQDQKLETWRGVTADPPDNVQFGWKNFYDEDQPLRSPAATMAIDPPPVFVSYQ